MERLELSKQKLLEPKPSAFTNFATSASFILSIFKFRNFKQEIKISKFRLIYSSI